jgi:hypothetical protein
MPWAVPAGDTAGRLLGVLWLAAAAALLAVGAGSAVAAAAAEPNTAGPTIAGPTATEAVWGQLHPHMRFSVDPAIWQVVLSLPDDYRPQLRLDAIGGADGAPIHAALVAVLGMKSCWTTAALEQSPYRILDLALFERPVRLRVLAVPLPRDIGEGTGIALGEGWARAGSYAYGPGGASAVAEIEDAEGVVFYALAAIRCEPFAVIVTGPASQRQAVEARFRGLTAGVEFTHRPD